MKIAMVIGLLAIALVGLGLPSASALDGPTPPALADPVAAGTYNEIQVIFFEGAVAGSYQLRIVVGSTTSTTVAIQYNDIASAVDSAIETATGGSVTVVGDDGTAAGVAPFTVTYSGGGLGGVDIEAEAFNFSTMLDADGAHVEPIVSTIQQGATTLSADVAPHGGYSSLTDYCLQCHQVHSARSAGAYPGTNGEYALLADVSVTSTCATCHGYLGESPTGAEDPGFPGTEGTASLRAVYTADPIHNIGYSSSRYEANWNYGGWTFGGGPSGPSTRRAGAGVSSAYGGGFYCGTCHTPHGEFGQLINSKWVYTTADQAGGASAVAPAVVEWENNARIWWNDPSTVAHSYEQRYLFYNSAPAGTEGWMVCAGLNGAGPCAYAQVEDAEGQLVSLYGYKLLSYIPNHQYPYRVNGQFSTGPGADNTWGTADDPTSTTPPGGMFADTGYTFGNLAAAAPDASNLLATRIPLGHLDADITAGATSFSVKEYATSGTSPDIENQALPFKIRIDDEVMMVTARAAGATDPDGYTSYTLTVTRSTENVEQPWLSTAPAATTHNIEAYVLLVPTLLVNDGPAPLGLKSGMRLPLHVTFSAGSGANDEVAVLMKRTQVSATQGLYTVGRGVDGTPQNETHVSGANLLAQTGTVVATMKSWATDIYDHDSALWCGSCHTYSVDAAFGGQWHSHPTGCTACHGNPADGSAADFPHSSTNEFMLQEFPDALCLECHTAGSLP